MISLVAQWLRYSLVAQVGESMPAMQETQVQSLGREDPLEKEMATHSSILAWRIPLTEEPGGLQSMGSQRVGHYWVANTSTFPWLRLHASIAGGRGSIPGQGTKIPHAVWFRKKHWNHMMEMNLFKMQTTTTKQVLWYAEFREKSTGLGRLESSRSFTTESATLANSFLFSEPQFLPP